MYCTLAATDLWQWWLCHLHKLPFHQDWRRCSKRRRIIIVCSHGFHKLLIGHITNLVTPVSKEVILCQHNDTRIMSLCIQKVCQLQEKHGYFTQSIKWKDRWTVNCSHYIILCIWMLCSCTIFSTYLLAHTLYLFSVSTSSMCISCCCMSKALRSSTVKT